MRPAARSITALRFGSFVANLRSGQLHRAGRKLKLQEQPFSILAMLLERAGDIVTREELRQRLWSDDTFVDFDHGINMAIAKIREVLGDSSENPRYIETLGRRGYRFIAPVEPVGKTISSSRQPAALQSANSASRHSVGRQKELSELRAGFASAVAGKGSCICVAGEPGIGKTTLVENFLAQLRERGENFLLAKGRCSERLAGSEAYLPFLEALQHLLRTHGNITEQKLRKVAPSWYAQLFPLTESDPSDAAIQAYSRSTTKERIKREISAFLEEIAWLEPLILFLDDLHWADSSTIDLLAYLLTKFAGERILVIGAYRPSELLMSKHSFITVKRDLQVRGICREIEVEFLTAADVEQYVALEFPSNTFAREFARLIHSTTEGNALFMVDLLRHLRNKEVIAKSGESGTWMLAQSVPDLTHDLPQSVRSMVEMNIAQVCDREREVLKAAAAQGYEFDSAAVARALQADNLEVEDRLEPLSRVHGFVKSISEEELPDGTLTIRCRFVHVLYQNALYSSLPPTRRTALSLSLAHALEGFYGDKRALIAPQLGFLYETAREPGPASDYFLLAAQNAQRIFANQEAIVLARRGLALLEEIPESSERTRKELALQVTLAFSYLCTLGYAAPETGTNMTRARELCRAIGDTASLLPIVVGLWTYYLCKADMNAARETAEQLAMMCQDTDDAALRLGACATLGFTAHQQGDLVASRHYFEKVDKLYDPEQHTRYVQIYRFDPGIHSQSEMTRTLWLLGFPDQARRKLEATRAFARSSPLSLAFCLMFAAWLYQELREPEKVKEVGEACIALCEEQGIMLERAWIMCPYGWALTVLDRQEEGISTIRIGLETQLAIGAQIARPQCLANYAEALRHVGRPREALAAVEEGIAVAKRNGDNYYDAELWRLKGELLLASNTADSEPCFQNAIEIARQQAAKSLELRACTSLAQLWRQQGRLAEARQHLHDTFGWFTEGLETADLRRARSLLEQLGESLHDSNVERLDTTKAPA
ncbi:MAG TPA: AAA family ATPase [Terriglobales bacterium]|nr:AAA family ATPase [Terriglobales bacterium]